MKKIRRLISKRHKQKLALGSFFSRFTLVTSKKTKLNAPVRIEGLGTIDINLESAVGKRMWRASVSCDG